MAHVNREKKKLLTRVRRVAGQVAALERAFESDADCTDVLIQIAAAKGAMHGLMMEVLTGHLAEHVVAEPSASKRAQEATTIIELLKGYTK
ncbi:MULTISPECIES: metal/formaldehyde-sensitive transcriptional repressor [unclassified Pseudoxanthomonas]|uniref:metal/formaldehyde-sensitive transcriptional repressor n=1 Tax=unclassified Pseudoxanthomonas TaxID=2645906 RepID=UPI0008E01BBD|nr:MULTISPECIES: metal/formaldehyde-sensitive transcriptional repressor [unclassified Pseudoxanthomonas]PPJ41285.1 metal/formaldehyde-sensitive transcriptional repressor [Pseudoxanthomonas sp. KAs_5_3]SFV30722.1 DNA-binding transcriptional regulator, FrmR family [Pseudoxanthomonas sp. YR558]